ncbi:MAG: cytochrome P450 [Proteobacteria bacterium]|nr:cytochrome P450 [Pseudomonadota bacterium]
MIDFATESIEVPGPHNFLGLGNILELRRGELPFLLRMARDYGDLVHVPLPGAGFYLLNHPDDIEALLVHHAKDVVKDRFTHHLSLALGQGLVTSEGELWRRHRKLTSFAFTPRRIRESGQVMVEVAARAITSWNDGAVIDLHAEMSRITMDVVGQVLFGTDVDVEAKTVGRAMEVVNEFFAKSLNGYLRVPTWLPTLRNLRFHRAIRQIDRVLFRIIADRRPAVPAGNAADGGSGGDLLAALLAANDGEKAGSALTDRELRDECVTLFLAGHETTALALVHAIYLLSKHPEVQVRFLDEVDRVLGREIGREHGQPLPISVDVTKLEYTARIIREAMRLYPPVWAIGREVVNEFSIRGRRFARGAQLAVSQWVVHRDPRWFPNPEAFDPERWTEERTKNLPRMAYFPFGAGPRICIGNHFATMEAVLLLALFGQFFEFELLPGERLDFAPSITLRPQRGLAMRLHARRTGAEKPSRNSTAPAA